MVINYQRGNKLEVGQMTHGPKGKARVFLERVHLERVFFLERGGAARRLYTSRTWSRKKRSIADQGGILIFKENNRRRLIWTVSTDLLQASSPPRRPS